MHDRDVDEEDRAPPEVLEQEAAERRARCATPRPATRGPDADRLGPLARVGEDVGEDRQGRRHDERAADAHQRPGADQLRPASADERGADGARAPKSDEADARTPRAAEPVAEAAGGEQQPGEHERVRVDDPLQLAVTRAQVA